MGNKIEVISCISSLSQVDKVFSAGADSIYAGLVKRSWQNEEVELSWPELIEAGKKTKELGKKFHLALNRDLTTGDIDELLGYREYFEAKIFDGIIVSDWGCMEAIRRISDDIEIHLSANTACVNRYDLDLAEELKVNRIVFSFSDNADKIKSFIRDYRSFEWEAIVYGGICANEVGYCPCSLETMNKENVTDICRYPLQMRSGDKTVGDNKIFGYPLCGGGNAEELYNAGVYYWKLEGRAKGLDHILRGTKRLRSIADSIEKEALSHAI